MSVERFKEGSREFSWTPKEREEHEKTEIKRRTLEGDEALRVQEAGDEVKRRELTKEEKKILEEMVPDEKTRASLSLDVIDMLLKAREEENREAA